MILLVDGLQVGIHGIAVAQRRRPEVQQYDLALERRELHVVAVHVGHVDLREIRQLDLRQKAQLCIHAAHLTAQDGKIGALGICLLDTLGNGAVIDQVAVAVEEIGIARQTLVKRIYGGDLVLVLNDETQLVALDVAIEFRIASRKSIALGLAHIRGREPRHDVVHLHHACGVTLVELLQQLRLERPLDRIVTQHAAYGVDRNMVAALQQ